MKTTIYDTIRAIYRIIVKLKLLIRIQCASSEDIVISFFGNKLKHDQIVTGGFVKLFHLKNNYKSSNECFNILYLVSSALPPYAEEWISIAKSKGIKVIWNQNGVAYPAWAGDNYNEINAVRKNLIHRSDYVIYQSIFCKNSSDIYLGDFKGGKSVIYNCVDTEVFKNFNRGKRRTPFTILVTGSHHQRERVLLSIEILKRLRDSGNEFEMIIAGKYLWKPAAGFLDALEEAVAYAKEACVYEYVDFLNAYTQEAAPELYNRAHVLLHLKYNDPCPTVPIEAMACGVPVVASACGGMPELLGKKGGILLPVEQSYEKQFYPTAKDACQAIVELSLNWNNASLLARDRALLFDRVPWIKSHDIIFRELLLSPPGSVPTQIVMEEKLPREFEANQWPQ